MLGKLESIILFVGDFEKSLEFYRDSLGLTLKAREGLDWVEFETNSTALILHGRVEQPARSIRSWSSRFEMLTRLTSNSEKRG